MVYFVLALVFGFYATGGLQFFTYAPSFGEHPPLLLAKENISLLAALAMVPILLPPQRQGVGFGILACALNIGSFIGPFIGGWLIDTTQGFTSSFIFFAVITACGLIPIGILAVIMQKQQKAR